MQGKQKVQKIKSKKVPYEYEEQVLHKKDQTRKDKGLE